tara:strand:- start:127 stop:390 length:264 start_codon:yes stop_codon:yes gene_type:complete
MKKRNYLILPEDIILDLMLMVSRLGETAVDYHNKVGSRKSESVVNVYTKIIRKLMELEEHDIEYKPRGLTFEQMLKSCGIKPNKEDE